LELCKEVHSYRCVETKNYNHASDWFLLISQEILDRYFFDEKSQCLQKLREDLKALKDTKNPYSIEENLHLHRLATVCCKFANDSKGKPEFGRTYLRSRGIKKGRHRIPPGFIQALSTWATELAQNPDIVTYSVKEFSTSSKVTNFRLLRCHKKAELPTTLEIPLKKPKPAKQPKKK
jgi:hypothetical protein